MEDSVLPILYDGLTRWYDMGLSRDHVLPFTESTIWIRPMTINNVVIIYGEHAFLHWVLDLDLDVLLSVAVVVGRTSPLSIS
jgi:hypothetical protein